VLAGAMVQLPAIWVLAAGLVGFGQRDDGVSDWRCSPVWTELGASVRWSPGYDSESDH